MVALVGDGSFLQTGTELAVAAMLNLPLVVVVLNNGGWEAIKDLQINLFGADRTLITDFRNHDGEKYFANDRRLSRGPSAAPASGSRIRRSSATRSRAGLDGDGPVRDRGDQCPRAAVELDAPNRVVGHHRPRLPRRHA